MEQIISNPIFIGKVIKRFIQNKKKGHPFMTDVNQFSCDTPSFLYYIITISRSLLLPASSFPVPSEQVLRSHPLRRGSFPLREHLQASPVSGLQEP